MNKLNFLQLTLVAQVGVIALPWDQIENPWGNEDKLDLEGQEIV